MVATSDSLRKFVTFCQQHIKGKERKEAQTFLDRFFVRLDMREHWKRVLVMKKQLKRVVKKVKLGLRI